MWQRGWEIVLRMEDLDGPRIKPGAAEQAIDVLRWLGLDWNEGPFTQLDNLAPYTAALEQLADRGAIYPCRCTRSEIAQAALSAPHADEHERNYPGTCRPTEPTPVNYSVEEGTAWRIRVPAETIQFTDQFAGEHSANVQQTVGDFLVATKQGLPSYQLAVVIDDARQEINQVVRGDDLLNSTARQLFLIEQLALCPVPSYTHLPLVLGEDGRRLAKRHGDSRLATYREQGVSAERIVGLLASWCGIAPESRKPMTARNFLEKFDLANVPKKPVMFTKADHEWLTSSDGVK